MRSDFNLLLVKMDDIDKSSTGRPIGYLYVKELSERIDPL